MVNPEIGVDFQGATEKVDILGRRYNPWSKVLDPSIFLGSVGEAS